ncbi:MAG: alpha-galactosidase [Candidatus Izemoplasmatales bacterium]|nr:alpha-galactosidase [Candidatus Izemoplasmatales bacterium]
MIQFLDKEKVFHLQTITSSYVIRILPSGHLAHVYYGKPLHNLNNIEQLEQKFAVEVGSQVIYDETDKTFNLNLAQLEISTFGKGDFRDPMLHFRLADGSRVTDFKYLSHEILSAKPHFEGLPETFDINNDASETIKITVIDTIADITVDLFYTVFSNIDILTRRCLIHNGKAPIMIEKAMSMNLDFPDHDFELLSLDGAWIRERHIHSRELTFGITKIDSKKGLSSSDHNPFVALKRKHTDEEIGECYGFSLIYSGNFEVSAEVSPHSLLRILMGINSFDFYWNLAPDAIFVTPEVVLTYSTSGLTQLSQNIHDLINNHIINPNWQNKERPILVNNWEATTFDFNERKLLKLARSAKQLGIELFVLDDGWFGTRNDDTQSLGDWVINPKKLPSGLTGLAKKINKIGLDFGIWVEPEAVNPNSNLYRLHPEWAVKLPNRSPSLGRNELILDLTRPEVREYLFSALDDIFKQANITYCKWDMNRNFSDIFSNNLEANHQGEFNHRYVLGLYELLAKLNHKYPHILFESCASGGNRFDIGMLYYMPQTWASDNTDGIERLYIQYGTSMAYPLSTIGAHVSYAPNMQTLRNTPIETRFNTAIFGLLGYELDLTRCSRFEKTVIKQQVEFYKEHRRLLQFGKFTRLINPFDNNECIWMVTSPKKDEAVVGVYQLMARPNGGLQKIKVTALDEHYTYRIVNRKQYANLRMFGDLIKHALPIRINANGILFNILANNYLMKQESDDIIIYGEVLNHNGFIPKQRFIGSGYTENVRLMGDFGSRVYYIKQESRIV